MKKNNIDATKRLVNFSYSSETPYRREFGWEILSHDRGAINTERLDAKATPLLLGHNWDQLIGKIVKYSIFDGRGYATAKISRSNLGNDVLQDFQDSVRTEFSLGYVIQAMERIGKSEIDGADEFLVTAYTPIEISCVSVPADFSIGLGRGQKRSAENTVSMNGMVYNKGVQLRRCYNLESVTRSIANMTTRTIQPDEPKMAVTMSEFVSMCMAGTLSKEAIARGRKFFGI